MPPDRTGTGPISTTANSKLDHASHFIGSSALLWSSRLRKLHKVQCHLLVEIVQMPTVTQPTRSEASTLTVQLARMAYSALYCMRLFGQTIRSCQREPTRISAGSECFYGCFEAFVGKHFPSACLYGLLQSKPRFEFGREGLGL